MAPNKKKINIPISSLPSEEIYALLDDIDSDYEEEIDNLMSDSDTEFVDRTAIENSESDISEAVIRKYMIAMVAILFRQQNLLKLW